MQKVVVILSFSILQSLTIFSAAQDSLGLKGQLSAWTLYNGGNQLPFYFGGRYIPQFNYNLNIKENSNIDFESSFNINGSAGLHPFDTLSSDGKIKPYRLWARYSTSQFELRLGLQKINFGSASLLRPLMWFDQVDPRDPLKLTDGVWGLLGRYYFLNNTNIWLWCLFGNKDPKGWEMAATNTDHPELGGRIQLPLKIGETALSFHHRIADTRNMSGTVPQYKEVSENRIGLDIKLDLVVGLWLEGTWATKNKDMGNFTNQEFLNIGTDYTFGIGNGLYVIYEHLLTASDYRPFRFHNPESFSLLSLSYPISLFDNISGIVYYDWNSRNIYNFLNWQKQFSKITLYIMGYWNPEDYKIPTRGGDTNLYSGKGIQIMLVLNH
jgi:hypothetical protein